MLNSFHFIIFFYRQRQKEQVSSKDALKCNKNRHDLYAEELVRPSVKLCFSFLFFKCLDHVLLGVDMFLTRNLPLAFLFDSQERLTIGRQPESVEDLIPEGEIILTINVYYPAVSDKVCPHLALCDG